MHFLVKGFCIITMVLVVTACATHRQEPLPASIQLHKTYYTQVAMHYDKGRHRTTNYTVGIFIPVNTPVKLLEFGDDTFVIQDETNSDRIEVANVAKHSQWTLIEAFDKLLGPEQVSLLKFNAMERENIEQGRIAEGMRKSAVIVARGYPPGHETPSLQRDQWKYWNSVWNTIIVKFKDDRVVGIKD